jgi:DNA-binding response OmpR family regulator
METVFTRGLIGQVAALPNGSLAVVGQDATAQATHSDRGIVAESPGAAYSRVLIVEDEATLRRIIAINLSSRGLLVSEAETAEAAVAAVAQERPDLILLDINLPDRTGWDVLRELRRRETEVPTIVISAVRANPSRLAEFHPMAYLPKPFPIEALLRLVFTVPGRGSGEQTENEDS